MSRSDDSLTSVARYRTMGGVMGFRISTFASRYFAVEQTYGVCKNRRSSFMHV